MKTDPHDYNILNKKKSFAFKFIVFFKTIKINSYGQLHESVMFQTEDTFFVREREWLNEWTSVQQID